MENTVKFCSAFLILFQPVVPKAMELCNGIDGSLGCCTGYKLNLERNGCIPCDRGFQGKNCDTKCPYPFYGDDCQSACNCNITYCDHINGCTVSLQEHFSKEFNYTSVTEDLINKVSIDKSSSSVTVENTTNFHTPMKTQSKRIIPLMLAIIGLIVGFLIIIMMYVSTGLLGKRLVNTNAI